MKKQINFYEVGNSGSLFVSVKINDEIVYTADGLEYIENDSPNNYISFWEDIETSWERGHWECDENAPTNEEAYQMLNEELGIDLIAQYNIDTESGVIDAQLYIDNCGNAGQNFLGITRE
jgi:hypothetical protein